MENERWTAVDQYFSDLLIPTDQALDLTLQTMAQAGLPRIQVTPSQGKFLSILAQAVQAHSILEIGTLGGYSTIWLARALHGHGRLITLEANPRHAAVAQANIANAGLEHIVDIRIGLALDSLARLAEEKTPPFDLVFIDADKPNNKSYFEWALKLTHPGSLIIIDNVVRDGEVVNARSHNSDVQGVRNFMPVLAGESTVTAAAIQTVGSKGYDGFAIALVNSNGVK
jgi:predicted O-methyltransferase YrrM